MVRRFHRSIYDELDDLKASMDYLFQLAFEPIDNPMLPEGENPEIVCLYTHKLNAEVTDHDDEVIVTVDIIPGIKNLKISVDLVNPDTLVPVQLTCPACPVDTHVVLHPGPPQVIGVLYWHENSPG